MINLRSHTRAGWTLTELMVAVSVVGVGLAIIYPLFLGDFGLYVRNLSLNKSNNSLRMSLQQLKRDVDMAIEPPRLVNFSLSGNTGVLTTVVDSTVSAQAIYMWVNLGPAYDLQPTNPGGTDLSVDTTGNITLKRHALDTADSSVQSPAPLVGDRLVFLSPAPLSTGMPESKALNGGTAIPTPGRRITSVSISDSSASDATKDTFTVTIDQGTPAISANKIIGNQSAYIVREVAYAAYTINDASGKPVERQLLYFPSTADMTKKRVLIRDLDPNPQEQSSPGVVIQPFNYLPSGRGTRSALGVNLPIRALDYANSIAERNLNGAASGTSPSEFNVYLRSSTAAGIKVRLD